MNAAMRDAMNNLKIDGSINTSTLETISARLTLSPAQQIMETIEQRIQEEVKPQVDQAEKDLIAIVTIELDKLGINAQLTNTYQFASGIADKYRDRLVDQRIAAIIDGLMSKP
ncbi:MAG: hypothetical protein M3Y65_16920 [Pseudomonadota bacterium]|nr:hypothetical protein [Pseudomonadota bacterium]